MGERIVRWFSGPEALGYGVSVLFHTLLLAVLALWVLDIEIPLPDLITKGGAREVGVKTKLKKAPHISLTVQGGQTNKNPQKLPPSFYTAPRSVTGNLPSDLVESLDQLAAEGRGQGEGEGDGDSDAGELGAPFGDAKPGTNAVTRGPFTVWSVPDPPRPREPYYIFIRIKVPKQARSRYSVRDLSGFIKGNDSKFGGVDYQQTIPFEKQLTNGPFPGFRRHVFRMDTRRERFVPLSERARNKRMPVVDGYATLAIKVPGAVVERVQDEIKISSKLLGQTKRIKLKFTNR